MGVCNCSMFCCTLLYVHSIIAIILMGKRELVALLNLYSWCLVIAERLFLMVPWGCLRFVIVVFPDHTHLLYILVYCYSPTPKKFQLVRTELCWYKNKGLLSVSQHKRVMFINSVIFVSHPHFKM